MARDPADYVRYCHSNRLCMFGTIQKNWVWPYLGTAKKSNNKQIFHKGGIRQLFKRLKSEILPVITDLRRGLVLKTNLW